MSPIAARILASERELCRALARLRFGAPVTHVYNPLEYARRPHAAYVERYARAPVRVLYFGMNPGPFGMAQTGVPFGEVGHVRDWLGIEAPVTKPAREHPKRPVEGFACRRSEVSGARLWGALRASLREARALLRGRFRRELLPARVHGGERPEPHARQAPGPRARAALCGLQREPAPRDGAPPPRVGDRHRPLRGGARRAKRSPGASVRIGRIPHPSPASPAANRGWAAAAKRELVRLGVCEGAG